MIALQGTRSDQYGASGIECFRCKELELPHLIARQQRAGKVITLAPDAATLPPSLRRPAEQVKRRWENRQWLSGWIVKDRFKPQGF